MMPTALATRMALHVDGQITWPEPEVQQRCDTCHHFQPNIPHAQKSKADAPPPDRLFGLQGPLRAGAGASIGCRKDVPGIIRHGLPEMAGA
jgi:hypothetical protein